MSLPLYTQVSKNHTMLDYIHGRCNIFALAFINLFDDAQAKYIWERNNLGKLIHCYFQTNKSCPVEYDARGAIDDEILEEYEADFNGDDLDYFEVSKQNILDDIHSVGFDLPYDNELDEIQAFIKDNFALYGLTQEQILIAA
jgi:hypothetical protein